MSARRWLALASFVVCLCLLAGLSAAPGGDETGKGNDKKGTNIGKAPGRSSSAAEAVRQTRLAHELIDYGRRAKSPEALITAAEILAAVPAAERRNDGPKETRRLGHESSGEKENHPAPAHNAGQADDPAALLAEAKAMAPGDEAVAGLANKVGRSLREKSRGELRGPQTRVGTVPAKSEQIWLFTFKGGEEWVVYAQPTGGSLHLPGAGGGSPQPPAPGRPAPGTSPASPAGGTAAPLPSKAGGHGITSRGLGGATLMLQVFDENLNPIASTTGTAPQLSNTPKWTGPFAVDVVNNGDAPVSYILYTN